MAEFLSQGMGGGGNWEIEGWGGTIGEKRRGGGRPVVEADVIPSRRYRTWNEFGSGVASGLIPFIVALGGYISDKTIVVLRRIKE